MRIPIFDKTQNLFLYINNILEHARSCFDPE